MVTEHVILGTQFRNLKAKPIQLKFSQRTGHVQLLRALASGLHIKPHRWAAETHETVTKEIQSRPRDIQIEGAHHLSWKALEVLRNIWDETDSEGPRKTVRIVLAGEEGFIQKIAKTNPQLADRAGIYPHV
jgi:type II secretory pathway predicted ATPase ExeA